MTGLIMAWLVGEGIIVYRSVARRHRPPLPAELLASSGLFVLLGLLAEAQPRLAGLLAWGVDLAAYLDMWGSGGPPKLSTGKPAAGKPAATGGATATQGSYTPPTRPSKGSGAAGSGPATMEI